MFIWITWQYLKVRCVSVCAELKLLRFGVIILCYWNNFTLVSVNFYKVLTCDNLVPLVLSYNFNQNIAMMLRLIWFFFFFYYLPGTGWGTNVFFFLSTSYRTLHFLHNNSVIIGMPNWCLDHAHLVSFSGFKQQCKEDCSQICGSMFEYRRYVWGLWAKYFLF